MRAPHSPRHSAAPVALGAGGRPRRDVRRGLWVLLVASGVYAVLVGTAALGGPSLGGPLFPEGRPGVHATSGEGQDEGSPTAEPAPNSTESPAPFTTTPVPTASTEVVQVKDGTTGTSSSPAVKGSATRPTTERATSPASSTTTRRPAPTASASTPGKSGSAPGATKKPPKPKP